MVVRCSFYVRRPAAAGLFHYDSISIGGPEGGGALDTEHPPAVGDLISLRDNITRTGGLFRVMERDWLHSSFGSMNWPYGEARPVVGPMLTILVEESEGMFRDKAPTEEENDV